MNIIKKLAMLLVVGTFAVPSMAGTYYNILCEHPDPDVADEGVRVRLPTSNPHLTEAEGEAACKKSGKGPFVSVISETL